MGIQGESFKGHTIHMRQATKRSNKNGLRLKGGAVPPTCQWVRGNLHDMIYIDGYSKTKMGIHAIDKWVYFPIILNTQKRT